VKWQDLVRPQQVQVDEQTQVLVQMETIPIVFVPGIMGSRLRRKKDWIWDPDNWQMASYAFYLNAASKQAKILGRNLDGSDLLVDETDAGYAKDHAEEVKSFVGDAPDLIDRGWPGVSWTFYGELLRRLYECEARKTWRDPLRGFFRLPVYAVGYNWTANNFNSGEYLKNRIDEIIKKHTDRGETCEQVILVTHSMGGLVSRSACMLHDAAPKVLGIIHGVQPVTGAPVAYWRMKAGFERISWWPKDRILARVLGKDQVEVTSLLGNMVGGLQLLPTNEYAPDPKNPTPGRWLEVYGLDGKLEQAIPAQDPYEEIYKKRTGLLKLVTDRYLLPGESSPSKIDLRWGKYLDNLSDAKDFHQVLGLQQHKETHVFYGTGSQHKTVDRVRFFKKPWYPRPMYYDEYGTAPEEPPPSDGAEVCDGGDYTVYTREGDQVIGLELQPADSAGDGTVPESSGNALKPTGESYGASPPASAHAFPGIEHSDAYSIKAGTFFFVFEAIHKLCRLKIRRAWTGP
jgi:hypothetical protein